MYNNNVSGKTLEDISAKLSFNEVFIRALPVFVANLSSVILAYALQNIVIETMLGRENSVQGPLFLKLLFVGLKTMSPSVTAKHPAHCNIFIVSPLKFP